MGTLSSSQDASTRRGAAHIKSRVKMERSLAQKEKSFLPSAIT
jgi:hypothetical protein